MRQAAPLTQNVRLMSSALNFTRTERHRIFGGIAVASPVRRPETINKLRFAADAALAMLAGMQLDVFTPLQAGPKTAEEIAHAIGVVPHDCGFFCTP